MKISAQEEYGLRCLLQLARADTQGESLTLTQIAGLEGISVANAGKLMWILNKAGLVQSQRGTKGGYRLSRPASEVRLNEVISVLNDESVETHCKSYAGVLDSCVHTGDCGIRPVIVELHQIVDNALSEITLSQLLGTEANVDALLHKIQGVKHRVDSDRVQA
ncbi:MAG: Rrf2 family transcriptional regulator [Acidobacteriota bacterium]|nr:Rrf2 family transcriptional regulator [Acidobacteriota bacterium]